MNPVTKAITQLQPNPPKGPAMDPSLITRLKSVEDKDLQEQLRIVEGILLAIYIKPDKGSQVAFQVLVKLFGDLSRHVGVNDAIQARG